MSDINLAKALAALYPDARAGRDYVVRDDGQGAFVALWAPALGDPPTDEAIATGWAAHLAAEQQTAYQRARASALAAAVPLDTLLAALVEAAAPEPGTPLASIKATWEGIKAAHPAP
jgi:hypothetical protein